MSDPSRLPNEGGLKRKSLYDVLEIERKATDDDIKKAYRRLALLYHPDKNLEGDHTKTEKFKEVNHAHSVLSNPQKRKIYDDYGEFGLKMLDQLGEERMTHLQGLFRPWVKWVMCGLFVLTAGCFGCFCCGCCGCVCCCNFCCGKYKPKEEDVGFDHEYNNLGVNEERNAANTVVSEPQQNGSRNQPCPTSEPIVLGPTPPSAPVPSSYGSTEIQRG